MRYGLRSRASRQSAPENTRPAEQSKTSGAKPQRARLSQASGVKKPRRPVDIEIQCGVVLPDDRLCGGSLQCKRHSLSAKRAVAGRSEPFDNLLSQYVERKALSEVAHH
jgi:SAGA-associated factor 73